MTIKGSLKQILVIRADEVRHRALSTILSGCGFLVSEIVVPKPQMLTNMSRRVSHHFSARAQFERDYFRYLDLDSKTFTCNRMLTSDINDSRSLLFADEVNPDIVITFGCPILQKEWICKFPDLILGIHLGLSPYYRGSGTNFFPFVNGELGAVGYTLMNLDEGIDTGAIFHQRYADIVLGDSIHTIGTRLMQNMFDDIVQILHSFDNLNGAIQQNLTIQSRHYRLKHFTDDAFYLAYKNLGRGAIESFIENSDYERAKFPLIRQVKFCID